MGFQDILANGLRTIASWIATTPDPIIQVRTKEKRPRELVDDEESDREAVRVRVDEQGTASPVRREPEQPSLVVAPPSPRPAPTTGMIKKLVPKSRVPVSAESAHDNGVKPTDVGADNVATAAPVHGRTVKHTKERRVRERRLNTDEENTTTSSVSEFVEAQDLAPYIYPGTNILISRVPKKTFFPTLKASQEVVERRRRIAAKAKQRLFANEKRHVAVPDESSHFQKSVEATSSVIVAETPSSRSEPAAAGQIGQEEPQPKVTSSPPIDLTATKVTAVPECNKGESAVTDAEKFTTAITIMAETFATSNKETIAATMKTMGETVAASKEQTHAMITEMKRSTDSQIAALTEKITSVPPALAPPPNATDAEIKKVVYGILDELKPAFAQLLQAAQANANLPNPQTSTTSQQFLPQPLSKEELEYMVKIYYSNKEQSGELIALQMLHQDLISLGNRGYDVVGLLSAVSTHLLHAQSQPPLQIQEQGQVQKVVEVMDESGSMTPQQMKLLERTAQLKRDQEMKEMQRRLDAEQQAQMAQQQAQKQVQEQAWQQAQQQIQQQNSFQNGYSAPAAAVNPFSRPLNAAAIQPTVDTILTAPSLPTQPNTGFAVLENPGIEMNCLQASNDPAIATSGPVPRRDPRFNVSCKFAKRPGGCKKRDSCPYLHPDIQNDVKSMSMDSLPASMQETTGGGFGVISPLGHHLSPDLRIAMDEQLQPNPSDPDLPVATPAGIIYYLAYMSNLLQALFKSRPSEVDEDTVCKELLRRVDILLQAIQASTLETIAMSGATADMFKEMENNLLAWDKSLSRGFGWKLPQNVLELKKALQKLGRAINSKLNLHQPGPLNRPHNQNRGQPSNSGPVATMPTSGLFSVKQQNDQQARGGRQRGRGRNNSDAASASSGGRGRTRFLVPKDPPPPNKLRSGAIRELEAALYRNKNINVRPAIVPRFSNVGIDLEKGGGNGNINNNNRNNRDRRQNNRNGQNQQQPIAHPVNSYLQEDTEMEVIPASSTISEQVLEWAKGKTWLPGELEEVDEML